MSTMASGVDGQGVEDGLGGFASGDAIAEAMMEVVIDDGEWEEDGDVTM